MAKGQLESESFAANEAAHETNPFEGSLQGRMNSDLVEGWDITHVIWRVFRDAGSLNRESLALLAELEISYYRCDLKTALEKANILIADSEAPIAMYARVMRMLIMVASGDGEQAYKDLLVLKDICSAGLMKRDDAQLFSASVISALRIEAVLMSSLFELPDFAEEVNEIPVGLKLYFGYLVAVRFLRTGRYREAYGSAFSYQSIVGAQYPGARTYLYCVEASAKMLMGDVDGARKLFDKAWALKDKHGILMPFIELNYALLGLPRINREELAAPEEVRRADALIASFSKGWYCLRHKCGLSVDTEPLTPLESYSCGLAALGWRNREIAKHLLLSESTVKHQLTSAYQKLNVSSRAELQKLYRTPVPPNRSFDALA